MDDEYEERTFSDDGKYRDVGRPLMTPVQDKSKETKERDGKKTMTRTMWSNIKRTKKGEI